MRTVWKYVIPIEGRMEMKDMIRPFPVHVGIDPQTGWIAVWIDHLTEQPERVLYGLTELSFQIVGTGHEAPEGWAHAGSVIQDIFVWHVYYQARAQ
jgi:hypothetical protein